MAQHGAQHGLGASEGPLVSGYDVAMLDLDGVVYVGEDGVAGAAEALEQVRGQGIRVAFVTNNASRTPEKVAAKIVAAGVTARAEDVVTSAQAAAHLAVDRFGEGADVAVLGAAGLVEALRSAGLVPVGAADEAVALITGYGPEVVWRDVMRAAVRVRDGLPWIASNTDLTIPTGYGSAPGHGVMVRMLHDFSGVEPVVAGKPARPLLDETVERTGAARPLMVGDRLDTDIEGARAADIDSLLVMTGVTGLLELVSAAPHQRPTYVSPGLEGLLQQHDAPVRDQDAWALGGWTARVDAGELRVDGSGTAGDWWRVAACAAWEHLDADGAPALVDAASAPR